MSPKEKPEKMGERVVVLETKVDAIEGNIVEIKTDQKKGFSVVGKKLDELKLKAYAEEIAAEKSKKERSTSFLGMGIPKKGLVYFVLGAGFILFLLLSGFPGLRDFLHMVNGKNENNELIECAENDKGEKECSGMLVDVMEMLNEQHNNNKEKPQPPDTGDGKE